MKKFVLPAVAVVLLAGAIIAVLRSGGEEPLLPRPSATEFVTISGTATGEETVPAPVSESGGVEMLPVIVQSPETGGAGLAASPDVTAAPVIPQASMEPVPAVIDPPQPSTSPEPAQPSPTKSPNRTPAPTGDNENVIGGVYFG